MNRQNRFLPWVIIFIPAAFLLFQFIRISIAPGWRSDVEYLDIIAELTLMIILLKWVHTASVLKRQQKTYWIFFSGTACLIWLMCLKIVAEVSLVESLLLQVLETSLAIIGVILLSMGIAAWSRDYQFLITETEEKKNQYKQLSLTDALTKLPNRAAYNNKISRFTKFNTSYVLILADLDHFKSVNDRYGHDAGDEALKHIAGLLQSNCRNQEECFRIGGEEFAISLKECSIEHAKTIAERIRTAIESAPVQWQGLDFKCTVSIGLCVSKAGESPQTTYRHADAALYQAKQEGRNCVVVSS
jgi:diguanylate cyclase (GGDEF)-like protein